MPYSLIRISKTFTFVTGYKIMRTKRRPNFHNINTHYRHCEKVEEVEENERNAHKMIFLDQELTQPQ